MNSKGNFPQWVITPRKLIADLSECADLDVPIVIQKDPEGNGFHFLRGSDDTKLGEFTSTHLNEIDITDGFPAVVLFP